jgi:hypothetical protein
MVIAARTLLSTASTRLEALSSGIQPAGTVLTLTLPAWQIGLNLATTAAAASATTTAPAYLRTTGTWGIGLGLL